MTPFITITSSKPTPDQFDQAETFLAEFLPRLEKQPGVIAIYHYGNPEPGEDTTIIVWENQEAVNAYRQSALIKEALAFEQAHGEVATRVGYPLRYATHRNS